MELKSYSIAAYVSLERKRRPEVGRCYKPAQSLIARALRLYEQEPGEPFDSSQLGVYVQRWVRWAGGGIPDRVVV